MMSLSIIEYYAEHERYKCGYCKKPDTSYSHGIWAHTMTVSDYQDLIDRGWRRSGKYCYKPTLDVTCCPSYTIRCKALDFKATKSQKKILKRINKYLSGETEQDKDDRRMSTSQSYEQIENLGEQFITPKQDPQIINVHNVTFTSGNNEQDDSAIGDTSPIPYMCDDVPETSGDLMMEKGDEASLKMLQTDCVPGTSKVLSVKNDMGPDPNKAPCKKAKLLRRERRLQKLKDKGVDITTLSDTNKNKEKQIEDFINELPENVKHKLEIKLVRTTPPSGEWLATAKQTHDVYVKYQMKVHGDTLEKCSEPKFKEFLVHSPLLEEHSEVGPPSGYGSFHQQYWLDGKILAVGVIDILPKCVSSVYFFYDPDYMHLNLGTYGALREIAFTRNLHTLCPELKYYYLGFYIHSCCKMRYKGNFHPSDLLCPETYKWFPIENCLPKLDRSPYSRLDPDIDSVDENFPKQGDINYIPIHYKGSVLLYKVYKKKVSKSRRNSEQLDEYLKLVGAKTAKKLVLVR
ncbi:Arginyl-tRNA--protein transferase 1 [Papilio machaon]|uniref:Arginyl-tRNA--protein transferase 1 n=1 Tax=Papilio machaon TaxID=76193 RepID=A0A194R8M4_PAPMA|nr:Arginyl-tRNA--protein transferase 1 [Papilio machaon]